MNFNADDLLRLDENINPQASENIANLGFEPIQINTPVDRVKILKKLLQENPLGCDFTLCLFIAALRSYRADKCLRPFPPFFINDDDEKDFQLLRSICDKIPSLDDVFQMPKKLTHDVLILFTWLFLEKGYPYLRPCKFSDVPCLDFSKASKPHYIFKVCYQRKIEQLWEVRRGNRDILYAYHGSIVDNFYSILKVGLQQHFSLDKEVMYGKGIYLSTELSLCAFYAPFGETWRNSALGCKHSVIAVCEVINDTNKVKYKDVKNEGRSTRTRYGDVPEKYFIVTDSEMLRVKYLLVYSGKSITSVKSFLVDNLFWILLFLYFIFLASIGFFNSSTWSKVYRYYTH